MSLTPALVAFTVGQISSYHPEPAESSVRFSKCGILRDESEFYRPAAAMLNFVYHNFIWVYTFGTLPKSTAFFSTKI